MNCWKHVCSAIGKRMKHPSRNYEKEERTKKNYIREYFLAK